MVRLRERVAGILLAFLFTRSSQTNLPPPTPGVFTSQATIIIDAPIMRVWDILLDFPSYSAWNPFVRKMTVTNRFWVPTDGQTAEENMRLVIEAQIPPLAQPVNGETAGNPLHRQMSFENITRVDKLKHQAAWRQIMLPEPILDAERWQALSEVDGGKTLYEAREIYRGPGAYAVQGLFEEGLQLGFEAQAVALKARAEGM